MSVLLRMSTFATVMVLNIKTPASLRQAQSKLSGSPWGQPFFKGSAPNRLAAMSRLRSSSLCTSKEIADEAQDQYDRQRRQVKVTYHKADVVFIDGERRVSKQCWSYRPEAQLFLDSSPKMVARAYFGMGTAASHEECWNFVVFGSKLSVLVAIVEVLEAAGLNVDRRHCHA